MIKNRVVVEVVSIRFAWVSEAPRRTPRHGDVDRQKDFRVLDDGKIAVEFDGIGRILDVQASSFVPGPQRLPETLRLDRELDEDGRGVLLNAVRTLMIFWRRMENAIAYATNAEGGTFDPNYHIEFNEPGEAKYVTDSRGSESQTQWIA